MRAKKSQNLVCSFSLLKSVVEVHTKSILFKPADIRKADHLFSISKITANGN